MGVYWCDGCDEWHCESNLKSILLRNATKIDPEELSDNEYCGDCGDHIPDNHCFDDPVELLNNKKVRV